MVFGYEKSSHIGASDVDILFSSGLLLPEGQDGAVGEKNVAEADTGKAGIKVVGVEVGICKHLFHKQFGSAHDVGRVNSFVGGDGDGLGNMVF